MKAFLFEIEKKGAKKPCLINFNLMKFKEQYKYKYLIVLALVLLKGLDSYICTDFVAVHPLV